MIKRGAAARYQKLESDRAPYVKRAEDAAKLTIPSLFPPANKTGSAKYSTPYQSAGARGLNNIAAKLLLAILPPNAPFFRLQVDDHTLVELTQREGMRAEVEKALSSIERTVISWIDAKQVRVTTGEAIKQLLVAGNALLYLPPQTGGVKLYRLNSYVMERDPTGNPLHIVTKDGIALTALPKEVQSQLKGDNKETEGVIKQVYTHVYLEDGQWVSYQEIDGIEIKGYENTYPLDKCPWIPLRLVKTDGEHYGRGYVEEYQGDLNTLESLSKAIVQASLAAAKVVFLVNPAGQTSAKKIALAASGDFVAGSRADIESLQLDKYADLQTARAQAEVIESRLSYAFMLNSAVQRGGERVTAEEIRYVAGELDDTLGGVYSILSVELQLPLVRRIMATLETNGLIPPLPKGTVEPSITTGLEAIGRGHDLQRLSLFMQTITPFQAELQDWLVAGDFITRVGTACGIDTAGLVRSQEEYDQLQQQRQEAAQQQQMMEQGMPIAGQLAKPVLEQALKENE